MQSCAIPSGIEASSTMPGKPLNRSSGAILEQQSEQASPRNRSKYCILTAVRIGTKSTIAGFDASFDPAGGYVKI
jgi:hypothetical protein